MTTPRLPFIFRSQAARAWGYLGLLAIAVVVADRSLGERMRSLYSRERAGVHGGRVEKLLKGKQRPFLLVLGSSRAAHGVDPARFPYPVYNLGHDGRGPYFALGVLKLLEEKGTLPPAVLLLIDRETFLDSLAAGFALRDRRFLRTLWKPGNWVDREASASWPLTDRIKFAARLYPYNGQLFYMLHDAALVRAGKEPPDGFEALERTPEDSGRLEEISVDSVLPARVGKTPLTDTLVARIADLARQRHVFIAAATAPEYRGGYRYYSKVSPHMDSLMAAQGIPYLDLNRLSGGPFDDPNLFKDRGHLDARGAAVLSDTLERWLEPLLRAKSLL